MFCVLTTKALDSHSFLMGAYNKGSIQVCFICVCVYDKGSGQALMICVLTLKALDRHSFLMCAYN